MHEEEATTLHKIVSLTAETPEAVSNVEGVHYNIPLTSSQKLSLTNIRLKRANVQKQIADLQTVDAKLEGFFHGELTRIAIENRINRDTHVLSDDLELKPMDTKA
jgi:hypothetical protein